MWHFFLLNFSHSDRWKRSGKPSRRPNRRYGYRPVRRNLQAKSVGSACLTCLGNPCPGATWVHAGGTQRHFDLARQGGLPSVRLQPSHGTPSQLRVTTWGPLCRCPQCVRLVQLLECRVQADTWYHQVLRQAANQDGRGAPCTQAPPSPPKICWGLASRGPHPPTPCPLLLQPALSLSGLLGPGSRSGSRSFSSHVFTPSFPSIIALFNPSPQPSPFPTLSLNHRPFQPFRPPKHCQHLCFVCLCSLLPTSSDRLEDPSPLPD